MYVYTVREPFSGFAKGDVLSQAQIDAYAAKGGHIDHHAIRVWQPDLPPAAPAARLPDSAPVNLA
jgi:hypothetical protein